MVTSVGSWDIDGKSYPNVGLSSGEGDPITFSVPEGVDPPPVFAQVDAEVAFMANGNKTRKRLLSWAPPAGADAA
jgi:hypothetical protein